MTLFPAFTTANAIAANNTLRPVADPDGVGTERGGVYGLVLIMMSIGVDLRVRLATVHRQNHPLMTHPTASF
jgi:hypothetical protein